MEALKELSPPFEMLDIDPGQTVTMTVLRWEFGLAVIHPRYPGAPPEKEVTILRIWVPVEQKIEQLRKLGKIPPGGGPAAAGAQLAVPPYWDIAQRRLQEGLKPLLPAPGGKPVTIEVQKIGLPPRAYFSVRVLP